MSNNFPAQTIDRQIAIDGMYRLGAVLHQSATGTVYETEFGENALPAVVKTRRLETGAEPLAAYWSKGIELADPNLLRVYASGHSIVDSIPVSYVVMERAEESLACVLTERALSEAETRQMLTDVLAALGYLHRNYYAHSRLKPSNVLAVGDMVKLSVDGVTPVGDGGTPADDMWALGSVIVQALTQKPPDIQPDSGPYILREASQPFTDIVRHCLDPDPAHRWTLDQVQSRLDSPIAAPVLVPPQDTPGDAGNAEVREANQPPQRTPRWVFAGLAALVLVVVLLAMVRKNTVPAVASAPAPVSNPLPPVDVKPPVVAGNPSRSDARGTRAGVWSVIVAAYTSREPAEKRSRSMARRWPNFKWSVFQQQAGKTFYLVVIGQNLSEDEAAALRGRAVESGLPRDTYIKKLP